MYQPTLLEDCLDPWCAQDPDVSRRSLVIEWLMRLCEAEGRVPGRRLPDTNVPILGARVPGADVIVVWAIADRYRQIAVRYLIDVRTGQWFGG